MSWRYYPSTKGVEINLMTVLFMVGYLALCMTPVILNAAADIKWKKIQEGGQADAG